MDIEGELTLIDTKDVPLKRKGVSQSILDKVRQIPSGKAMVLSECTSIQKQSVYQSFQRLQRRGLISDKYRFVSQGLGKGLYRIYIVNLTEE